MRKAIAPLLLLLLVAAASAAEFSSLEERMSQEQFHAAGLDKLSPEELKTLDEWVRSHSTATSTTLVTTSGKPVFYPNDSNREAVESRIDGTFSGWRGHTIFRLENGQEWSQAESGQMTNGTYEHPKVKVKPMLIGSWLMYIEPCGCSVRVDRIK